MCNLTLKKIFNEDQADRRNVHTKTDFETLALRDAARRKIALNMLNQCRVRSARDLYFASMIFHHGPAVSDARRAVTLARRAATLGYKRARWLYAAAVDRQRIKQGRKQKYGTQFYCSFKTRRWRILPLETVTSDKERASWNVPPLHDILLKLKRMNENRKKHPSRSAR